MVGKTKKINEDVGQGVDTVAGRTIQAGAGAGSVGPMKMQVIQDFLGLMQGADSAMVDAFNKTIANFGPGVELGVKDNSEFYRNSVQTHNPNPVRESLRADLEQLFSGTETITEEFKSNAVVLFEAALNSRILLETARIEAEHEKKLEDESEEIYQFLTEKVNDYIEYVADQWIEENQIAIQNTLRTELAEEFIEGIKNVFVSANVAVPEEKIDVVDALANKVEELETKLNEAVEENISLSKLVIESEKQKSIAKLTEGLNVVQAERMKTLMEGVEFEGDLPQYQKKLQIIKENASAPAKPRAKTNLLTEEYDGPIGSDNVVTIAPDMQKYVKAISRTVVKD